MHVIQYRPCTSSRREQEIQTAQIKAWAAQASHRSRRKKKLSLKSKFSSKVPNPKALIVGKNKLDPFNCMVIPLSAIDVQMLQRYFSIIQYGNGMKMGCPSCAFASESFSERLHMYSLLALSAARVREVEKFTPGRRELPEYYYGKAISELRQRMNIDAQLTSDRHVMLDIFRLSTCEWYLHNEEAARTHLSYFIPVWDTLDIETSHVDLHLHNCIALHDIMLAIAAETRPVLSLHRSLSPMSRPTWDRFSQDHITGRGSAIYKLCETANLGEDLKCILYCIINFSHTNQIALENQHLPGRTRRILRAKVLALMHTLRCHNSSNFFEQALQWTLLIITIPVVTLSSWLPGKINMVLMADRLQRFLPTCWGGLNLAGCDNGNSYPFEVWLWMCMTGAHAASGDRDKQAWFLQHATHFARRLRIIAADQLESKLEEFVLCKCVHGEAIQALTEAMDLFAPTLRRKTIYDRISMVGYDVRRTPSIHDF